MWLLVLGLVLFLGVHSVRIVADGWRTQMLARMGEMPWKGLYSLVSAVGLALIVWGYGQARQQPVVLWVPPIGMRHAAALLTLVAFVLLAATYVPRNAIKARLHHPMVLGVKVWAVLSFRAARQRDRAQGTVYAAGSAAGTAAAVVVGLVAWAGFAFWGHAWLIGVAPLGR